MTRKQLERMVKHARNVLANPNASTNDITLAAESLQLAGEMLRVKDAIGDRR